MLFIIFRGQFFRDGVILRVIGLFANFIITRTWLVKLSVNGVGFNYNVKIKYTSTRA